MTSIATRSSFNDGFFGVLWDQRKSNDTMLRDNNEPQLSGNAFELGDATATTGSRGFA